MDTEKMKEQLMDRLTENYGDYRANLLLYDRQELIDRASQIADTASVHEYLTQRPYTEQELSFLLEFQNPLEVMVDGLRAYEQDYRVLDGVLGDMVDRQDQLTMYPLMRDAPALKPETMRKFMNVDIESALKQLRGQMTVNYQNDLNYALNDMRRGADQGRPEGQNFVVFFRQNGVECMNERDLFISDTRSFNTCQYFHTMTSDPVLAYAVEITGENKGKLRGNLYQVDNHQLAEFAARASSPFTSMTLRFLEGHEALISREDYKGFNRDNMEYRYGGHIMDTRFEPEDESVVQAAIRREHDRREQLPKGHLAVHVAKLEDSRIQAEADRITAAFQGLTEPNSQDKDKAAFTVQISEEFTALSEQRQLNTLFGKLKEQMPDKPLYVDYSQHEARKFSIAYHADTEQPEKQAAVKQADRKPSVRAQLAAKPPAKERPAGQHRPKDREAR